MISIYKITSPLFPNTIYIGSTKKTIEERFSKHKNEFNKFKIGNKQTCRSYPLLKYGTIKLLEICEEKDRYQRELIYMIVAKTIMKCVNYKYPLCKLKCRRRISTKRFNQSENRLLYKKKYNQTEKNKLYQKTWGSEKVACSICNSIVTKGNLSTHKKSKKCQKFISKQL